MLEQIQISSILFIRINHGMLFIKYVLYKSNAVKNHAIHLQANVIQH